MTREAVLEERIAEAEARLAAKEAEIAELKETKERN